MRLCLWWLGVTATIALAGCQKAEYAVEAGKPGHRGRFVGVGIYSPHRMWTQLVRAAPQDRAAATLEDDEQVIVVVDSATGEIRQCGNLSGHCLSFNPWSASKRGAPLLKHAQQLDAEEKAEIERVVRPQK
jgi:hypothetical protein